MSTSKINSEEIPAWIADAVKDLPPFMDLVEAADVVRQSERTMRRLIVDGRIHALRNRHTGSAKLIIPRSEIARYLTSLAAGSAL